MKAVKAAVILMSILIVAGFGVVVYTIVARMMAGEPVLAVAKPGTETEADATGFGEVDLQVPVGCELDTVQLTGQRLLITLNGLEGQNCRQIIMMDASSGEILGRVRLQSP